MIEEGVGHIMYPQKNKSLKNLVIKMQKIPKNMGPPLFTHNSNYPCKNGYAICPTCLSHYLLILFLSVFL